MRRAVCLSLLLSVPATLASSGGGNWTLQLLHFSDGEAGTLAPQTAPNLAAIVDKLEDLFTNSITLSGGDNYIPSPFQAGGTDGSVGPQGLNPASTPPSPFFTIAMNFPISNATSPQVFAPDIVMHDIIGVQASAMGNHEFDLGSAVVSSAISTGAANYPGARWPYISSNLDFTADSGLSGRFDTTPLSSNTPDATALFNKIARAAVITENGEKIGILGCTTQRLKRLSSPDPGLKVLGFTGVDDAKDDMPLLATQLQPIIDDLTSEGINKIILLSHLQDIALEKQLATLLSNVDIIIAAGSHTRMGNTGAVAFPGHSAVFAEPYPYVTQDKTGNTTVITCTDNEYTYLGRLVVDFNSKGEIIPSSLITYASINNAYASATSTVASVWGTTTSNLATTAFAPGTRGARVKLVTDAVQGVIDFKNNIIHGYSNVYLEGERIAVRNQETNLGDLTADANLAAAREALGPAGANAYIVSLKNGGGIRAQIGSFGPPPQVLRLPNVPDGRVTQLDVENSLRFNNRLIIIDTTPQGLKNILETGGLASVPGSSPGGFPQVGGVAFSWDPNLPARSRIVDLAIFGQVANGPYRIGLFRDGKLISGVDPTMKISMVMLSFNAQGGDGYQVKANADPANFRYITIDNSNNLGLSAPVANVSLDLTATPPSPANGLGEQEAFARYLQLVFTTAGRGATIADTPPSGDLRIQNLNERASTVVDTNGPTAANCPSNRVILLNGTNNATVSWSIPIFTDPSGVATLTRPSIVPGSIFLAGVTTLNYTATDMSGNVGVCSFTVSLQCPGGQYASGGVCTACPSNRSTSVVGSTAASACHVACGAGDYWNTNTTVCTDCPINTYWAGLTETAACTMCDAGRVAPPSSKASNACIWPLSLLLENKDIGPYVRGRLFGIVITIGNSNSDYFTTVGMRLRMPNDTTFVSASHPQTTSDATNGLYGWSGFYVPRKSVTACPGTKLVKVYATVPTTGALGPRTFTVQIFIKPATGEEWSLVEKTITINITA